MLLTRRRTPAAAAPSAAAASSPGEAPSAATPAAASPAVASPAVAPPAVSSPAVASPAVSSPAAAPPAADAAPAEAPGRPEKATWGFEEGDELSPGRIVIRFLGGGSAYEVFLVWDEERHALMVAKVLRPDRAEDPEEVRSLRKEVEALEALAHPVIVRGFGAVLDGPHPHVLIEHLEGPSLRKLLKRHGPLPAEQLLPLAMHVAAALHYMAAREMVHLDVKPDNIIMGVPPRLIDLSVARSFERARRIAGAVGTDSYMAPEQCDPAAYKGQIGPPADVFGLAATLWHCVTGHAPFAREKGAPDSDDLAIRFPQLHAAPRPLPPKLAPELAEALHAGLGKDPASRPAAAEFAAALEPLVAKLPRRLVLSKRGARFR